MIDTSTRSCTRCGEEIKARAQVCYHCGAEYEVAEQGYCQSCHDVRPAVEGRCETCNTELVDTHVESRLTGTGALAPPVPQPPPPAEPPAPPAYTAPAPAAPPVPTRKGRGGIVALWVFAVILALVGLGGFALATAADNGNRDTFAADYRALGTHDATDQAAVLARLNASVKTTFDAYMAAEEAVWSAHEAVTSAVNDVVANDNAGNTAGAQAARDRLGPALAAYEAAVAQEQAAQQSFLAQLALLQKEVAS